MGTNPTHNLIKLVGWYRGPKKEWENDKYGFYPRGMGDLIFNNMKKIAQDGDTSEWALWNFHKCLLLLQHRERWPDWMEADINRFARCRPHWWFSKWKYEKGVCDQQLFRPRKSMTRDPFIAFFHCAVVNGWDWGLYRVRIPFWLYSPKTWAWHRLLKNPTERNFKRYDFWFELTSTWKKDDYVVALDEMRENALKIKLAKDGG